MIHIPSYMKHLKFSSSLRSDNDDHASWNMEPYSLVDVYQSF